MSSGKPSRKLPSYTQNNPLPWLGHLQYKTRFLITTSPETGPFPNIRSLLSTGRPLPNLPDPQWSSTLAANLRMSRHGTSASRASNT